MRHPWWMSGVKFACQSNCGKCCDEPGGIVYLSKHDARRISSSMGLAVEEWLERDCQRTLDGRYILKSSCLLYTSPSPRDLKLSRMPSSA